MKEFMKALMILGTLWMLAACSAESKDESFSYQFSYNGCDTGKQTFNSLNAYCDGLRDEARNKSCAYSLRYDTFTAKCPGRIW
nr:hypothetical protein HAGR004_29280 [Bdellovibrio sp. HAGR004]